MPLKNEVLKMLEKNRQAYISGQELAQTFCVTRSAVWKTIKALRDDGYDIEAATNKGYRLSLGSDVLSAEGISAYLRDEYKNNEIQVFEVIDSTNTYAKKLAADGAKSGTIILATTQTNGRGRMGRSFYSPASTGIYMSVILRTELEMSKAVLITVAAAVAVCRAIERLTQKEPKIKWVNDIFIDGKKVCGILTEAAAGIETGKTESIIVGIGLNVSTEDFPAELKDIAGAISKNGEINKNQLTAEVINELLDLSKVLDEGSFTAEYRDRSTINGKRVEFLEDGMTTEGVVIDIDIRGRLVIEKDDGSKFVLQTGEAKILPTV